MKISLHTLTTANCNILTDVRIAKETGYDGIELNGDKLRRFLANGFALERLQVELEGISVSGLDYVQDIERQEPAEYDALLEECETICAWAETMGSPMVQLLTGPLYPDRPYRGLEGKPWPEMRKLTAKNLATLADIGKAHNVKFYLEALSWTPLCQWGQALEVIDAAERDNVGLVVDFWHFWGTGATPEDIARLKKEQIYLVHCCDSLDKHGQGGDFSQRSRDVWIGGGNIPLKEWIDAVRSTGFDGWWACEVLSPKLGELDPWDVARDLRTSLRYLLI